MDPNQNTQTFNTQPMMQAAAPLAPNSSGVWPGAFGIYKKSAEAVKFNLGAIVGSFILGILASIIGDIDDKDSSMAIILVSIVGNILAIVFAVSLLHASILSARFQKISLGTALKKGFSFTTLKYLWMCVVIAFMILGSLLALIVPFFFVAPRLSMAPYFMLDQNLGPIKSIKASWEASKGHVSKVYGLIGVSILIALSFVILIGFYFFVMYAAAFALLYLFVTGQDSARPQEATAQSSPTAPTSFATAPVQPASPAPVQNQGFPAPVAGLQNIPPNQQLTFSPTPPQPQPQAPVQQPVAPIQPQPQQQPNQQ